MPEVNTEKIFASFLLSVEQVTSIDEFNDLEKEYLGKNSLISEERKKLSNKAMAPLSFTQIASELVLTLIQTNMSYTEMKKKLKTRKHKTP